MDDRVLPDPDRLVDEGRRRIGHGDAGLHHAGEDPAPHAALGLREFLAAVDADHLVGIGHRDGHDAPVLSGQEVDGVREIVLALPIGGADARKGPPQLGNPKAVDAHVDLPDGALLGSRVPVLHDAPEAALAVPEDPAEMMRPTRHPRGHRRPGGEAAHRLPQRPQRRRRHKRHVRVHHVDQLAPQAGQCLGDRVAGPEGAALDDVPGRGPGHRAERRHVRPNDQQRMRHPRSPHGVQDVHHHRPAAQRMQDLGEIRFHPRAPARGQDDGCQLLHQATLQRRPQGNSRGTNPAPAAGPGPRARGRARSIEGPYDTKSPRCGPSGSPGHSRSDHWGRCPAFSRSCCRSMIVQNASTTRGSNWVPAQRRNSVTAS